MTTMRQAFGAAVLFVLAFALTGCGDSNSKPQDAKPQGEQSIGKEKGKKMPAPPPIEKVN